MGGASDSRIAGGLRVALPLTNSDNVQLYAYDLEGPGHDIAVGPTSAVSVRWVSFRASGRRCISDLGNWIYRVRNGCGLQQVAAFLYRLPKPPWAVWFARYCLSGAGSNGGPTGRRHCRL